MQPALRKQVHHLPYLCDSGHGCISPKSILFPSQRPSLPFISAIFFPTMLPFSPRLLSMLPFMPPRTPYRSLFPRRSLPCPPSLPCHLSHTSTFIRRFRGSLLSWAPRRASYSAFRLFQLPPAGTAPHAASPSFPSLLPPRRFLRCLTM